MEVTTNFSTGVESQRSQSNVFQFFQTTASTLSDRYERQERVKKLGRDVTFESKHVIFLLQRCANARESEMDKIFAEADERVKFIDESKFKEIAREVAGLNGELYARSYDWGLEEYIEAMTFFTFLRERRLITLEEIQKKLCFRVTPNSADSSSNYFSRGGGFGGGRGRGGRRGPFVQGARARPQDAAAGAGVEPDSRNTQQSSPQVAANEEAPQNSSGVVQCAPATTTQSQSTESPEVHVRLVVMPLSYLLGLADLTGELMRFAVTRVPRAPLAEALALAAFAQSLASALHRLFGLLPWNQSQAARKVSALVTNVLKIENAMYVRVVRGKQMNLVLAAPALLRHLECELNPFALSEANAGDSEDAPASYD